MGWPGAPPFMPMPGIPMMPPPWAMPWGMPMPGMPVAYDAEEAERQLRRAEKAARKEGRRQKGEGNDKTQVWEDHPARAQKKHSSSRSKSYKSRGRERSRAKDKGKKSKSSSEDAPSRSPRSEGRSKRDEGDRGTQALSGKPVQPDAKRSPERGKDRPDKDDKEDSGDSDVDLSKVQEEINFADI